jgi:glycosyltransferase involved in cell wall biosynthesis
VVVHAHGGRVPVWLTSPLRRSIARLSLLPAERVLAVSRESFAALERALGPERVAFVHNGVDQSAFGPTNGCHGPPRVLYVGLLTPRKGILDLFAASEMLRERNVPHELWLVGGAPDEGPAAEAEVRRAAGPGVRFLGARPHETMPGVYGQADVFCLPSWREAAPLSVLEAMAAGLPVVASAVGDVPSMVEDQITGLLVPPRAPERLADALELLLADPARRRAMGTAGRSRVASSFTIESTLASLEAVYVDLESAGESQLEVRRRGWRPPVAEVCQFTLEYRGFSDRPPLYMVEERETDGWKAEVSRDASGARVPATMPNRQA